MRDCLIDPIIHGFLPVAILVLIPGLREKIHKEGMVLALSAVAPDIDILLDPLSWFVSELWFLQHRIWTHSIAGSFLLALLLLFVVTRPWIWEKIIQKINPVAKDIPLFNVHMYVICLLGIWSHIFLDWLTPWGPMLLFPLVIKRFSLNLMESTDLMLLLASMICAMLLLAIRLTGMSIKKIQLVGIFMILFVGFNGLIRIGSQATILAADNSWNNLAPSPQTTVWVGVKWEKQPELASFTNQTYIVAKLDGFSGQSLEVKSVPAITIIQNLPTNLTATEMTWEQVILVLQANLQVQHFFVSNLAPAVEMTWDISQHLWSVLWYDASDFLDLSLFPSEIRLGKQLKLEVS